MLNEGQVLLSEGSAATVTALPEPIAANTGFIETLKNAMQPDVIANRLGMDKNMLVDITLYGAIGFIVGFLLKKYSEYFISMALLVVGIVVLQQLDYVSFSINVPKIHQLLGLQSGAVVADGYGYGMLLWESIKSNVAGSISLLVGFLIGLKIG
jgi:uncharacterized membrane protein (Fun14 family)